MILTTALEIEPYLVATLIVWPETISDVARVLLPVDFYETKHSAIYGCLLGMVTAGRPVDLLTLMEGLRRDNLLDAAGGEGYLRELSCIVPASPETAEEHASIIRDRAGRRQLKAALRGCLSDIDDEGIPVQEIASRMEAAAIQAVERKREEDLRIIGAIMPEVVKNIEAQAKGEITGLRTGFPDIDRHLSGFQKSDLIVLAGQTRMGKTSLACDIATHAAVDEKKIVAFFENEMSARQIAERIFLARSKVNGQLIRTGKLPERDYPRLRIGMEEINPARLYIDGSVGLTPLQILAKCRRLQAKIGLDLVVVDVLQKIRGDGRFGGDKRKEVAAVSEGLKNMAKMLDVPVIGVSHLSRAPALRADHEPVLSDLHESGNIEQDADIVLFIYREEVYQEVAEELRGRAKAIIAKYRNGQDGFKYLHFNKDYSSFSSWSGRTDDYIPVKPEQKKPNNPVRNFYGTND